MREGPQNKWHALWGETSVFNFKISHHFKEKIIRDH